MSTLEEKRKKLLALRAQNRNKQTDRQSRLQELRNKRLGINTESNLDSTKDESVLTGKEEKEEPESALDLQTHVGILNLTSKQPNYKYDRSVGVTKEELDLFHLLSKEQEDPMYPPPLDAMDENREGEEQFSDEEEDKKNIKVKYVSEEEKEKILESKTFRKFVRRKSIEMSNQLDETKALIQDLLENENPEIAQDLRERIVSSYKFEGVGVEKISEEDIKSGKVAVQDTPVILDDELWSVMDVQWCRMKAEWFLAVYRKNSSKPSSSEDEQGRVVIWEMNPKNKDTKECVKILTCTKMVNRAIFSPTNENFVYGALSSGQIVVWDLREKSRPINHSRPILDGHNLPIYCLENISDGRRDLLLSVSNEGKLCIWNPDTLGDPEITEELTFKPEKGNTTKTEKESKENPLAPIASLIHPGNGPKDSRIFLSTLDKLVQSYNVNSFITKQENHEAKSLVGHDAPICSISLNRTENVVFKGLLLTGSFDFSICLWKPDTCEEPLLTYEVHDDYITGIDWNPRHPAMFVSVDCGGKIALWDLIEDKDYPVFVSQTDPITSVKWHPDGVKLLVSTLSGNVELWSIKKRFLKFNEEQKAELEAYISGY